MESDSSFINSIPVELRAMIFKKLPQNKILQLRCVCQQLKIEVDNLYNFDFNNSSPLPEATWKTFPRIKIRKCTITRPPPVPLYSHISSTLITFPNLLRCLKIKTINIFNKDYQSLLEECCQNLIEFSLLISNSNNDFTAFKSRIIFKNLVKLELVDYRLEFVPNDVFNLTAENDIFLNIVENISPNSPLNSITFILSRRGAEQHKSVLIYTHAIFLLILQHKHSLRQIGFYYSNVYTINPTGWEELASKFSFDHLSLTLVTNLVHIDLDYTTEVSPLHSINSWKYLIAQQSKLEHLEIKRIDTFLDDGFLEDIISKNALTLKNVMLTLPNNSSSDIFDMQVFKNCERLKKLKITGEFYNSVTLRNFTLPESLEELELSWITAEISEISGFFLRETRLKNIRILSVTSRHMRVNGLLLRGILNQPLLTKLVIYFDINEEDEFLSEILTRYCPNRGQRQALRLTLLRDLPGQGFQAFYQ